MNNLLILEQQYLNQFDEGKYFHSLTAIENFFEKVNLSLPLINDDDLIRLFSVINHLGNKAWYARCLIIDEIKVRQLEKFNKKELTKDEFKDSVAKPLEIAPSTAYEDLQILSTVRELGIEPRLERDFYKLALGADNKKTAIEHAESEYDKFNGKYTTTEFRKWIKDQKPPAPPLEPAEGKYQVIIIDPPWKYGTEYNVETRRVASPYAEIPTWEKDRTEKDKSSLEQFEIPADDNAIIWLWTTHKFLPDALELLKVWGFDYKAALVWDKQMMGMGAWLRMQVEFCLLGIKGKPQWHLTNERDILSVARREHSRKPDEFYEMVKQLSPNTKRIDIFSREKREGFEQYGNETDKF